MKRKAKAGWLFAAVVVLCPSAAFLPARALRQEPELLKKARFIATGAQWQFPANYLWLSNHMQFCQRGSVYTNVSQYGPFRFDTVTKNATYDAPLKAALKLGYGNLQISQDRKWLLSGITQKHDIPNKPVERFYTICRMDGSQSVKRPVGDGFMGRTWCADSHHWLEFYGKHVAPPGSPAGINMNAQPMEIQRVTIGSVDTPGRAQNVNVPPAGLLREPGIVYAWSETVKRLFALTPNRFLTYTVKPYPQHQVVMRDIGLQSVKPLREYVITPPGMRGVVDVVFSPTGERIGWKLVERIMPNTVKAAAQSRSSTPAPIDLGSTRISLWVSQRDGSKMHEIGVMPPNPIPMDMSGPIDPETGEHTWGPPVPRLIRWTPDSKTLSFAFKGDLYTVPAD